MDNDINRQSVEESLRETDKSQDGEREIAQSPRGEVIEETGDSWLRQASENKARSRAPRMEDVNFDPQVSVTNILQESENKQKMSTSSMYLKPTTMRGIPLASLTPSPIIRGFYITKSEIDLLSLMDNSTPSYITDASVEQQTETILISDISMTDETVTVAHNQIESRLNVLDDNLNNINNKIIINNREEKYSTPSSSVIFSKNSNNAENLSNHEKSDLITTPITRPTSKRRNSLRYFDHITPISNSYVSSTTPTRRRIADVVSKYTEATTPLWTGRRIVAKKRNRTAVSPIKDAIKRTENAVTSILKSASLTAKSAPTLISRRRKLPTTSMISIPSIMPDSTPSSEILTVCNNLANSNDKTEDPESHATEEVAMTLTNSVIATTSTPSTSKIISITNDPTIADISMLSDDTTMIVPATNASIISPVAKAPTVTTDATTSAITSMEIEITSLNYSVTDNPIIENINSILTDSTTMIAFPANTESDEVSPTNVNVVPETVQTIATDSVIKSAVASTEIETISTNYSTIAVPDTTNVQEIDSANTTTVRIINADIGNTATTVNYSEIPTTINMHDIISDTTLITAASAEIETTSMIGNHSTFTTTITNTTIPITTISPLTTVISSTVNTQHIHTIAPTTTSNLVDANTVIANMITTPFNIITDLNIIMTSANTNIPSTSATSETSLTTVQSRTSSVTSSETPITNTVTSTNSAAPPTLTTEFSTIPLTNLNKLDVSNNSEILSVTATTESTQIPTTEIPMTFETPFIFTSTTAKSLHSTNFEPSPTVTSAIEGDKSFFTPKITQISSTLLPIAKLITNKATIALKRFTTSETPSAIFGESITTNPIIRTTSNAYDVDFVRTISEVSTIPERKIDFKETTSTETQNQIEDHIITTINKPSSIRTTSDKSTTPKIKIVHAEKVASKTIKNRKQNQTTSELDAINYQFTQKTARRRVLNRTNNWLGSPLTLPKTNQYPRHWVTYRGQSRPSTYISSSRNRRRRIMQKRTRVNSEAFNSIIKSNEDTIDVQNTTKAQIVYDRMENVSRMKVVMEKKKEKNEEEMTTILPIEETTVFLQSSITTENETLQIHHENGNIEEKQKIIVKKIKQSDKFTTKETNTNSNSNNENFSNNSQNNLHVIENLFELEKPKQIAKIEFENVSSQFEEKNPIEDASINSDSINTNLQNNFSKTSYADKNLSDRRITGRRMRVILKSVRPKSEVKNSTIEETSMKSNSIDKNQNNLSNNVNISPNFSNKGKPRRRMRVILKRVKSESDEGRSKIEEANTEHDSINESLQGTFSNNFYSAKNFPFKYGTRRRMRVVLKSVKPKSEDKNLTVEHTTVESDSSNKNLQDTFSDHFRSDKNFSVEYGTKRRTRVILKSVKLKSEKENSTVEETSVNSDSIKHSNKNIFQNTFLNHSHGSKNLPVEYRTRRRMRVILKNVKPKSEERNSTIEETSIDSDSVDKDLQDSFSSNLHMNENLSDEEEARRRMKVVLKSIKPKFEERDSIAKETSADSDFARKDPQVLYTFHFSSNFHVGDNLDKKKEHSKPEEKGTMTERPEDMEPQITRTSVSVEEDTDQPSLEVSAALSRRPTLS